MKLKLNNQLNMVGACLAIAQSNENKTVWNGQPPLAFATDIAALRSAYDAVLAKAARADSHGTGATEAKAAAEAALENNALVVARALVAHFRKTGARDLLARVDLSATALRQMRNQELLTKSMELRDLATATQTEPGAEHCGLTAARLQALSDAITTFGATINAPRERMASRGALLEELDRDVAALVQATNALDDLVVQFGGTPAGDHFVATWERARIIVDRVGRTGGEATAAKPVASSPTAASGGAGAA